MRVFRCREQLLWGQNSAQQALRGVPAGLIGSHSLSLKRILLNSMATLANDISQHSTFGVYLFHFRVKRFLKGFKHGQRHSLVQLLLDFLIIFLHLTFDFSNISFHLAELFSVAHHQLVHIFRYVRTLVYFFVRRCYQFHSEFDLASFYFYYFCFGS